jgi:hypothetical protein
MSETQGHSGLMLILATLGQATLARSEPPQGLGPSATSC